MSNCDAWMDGRRYYFIIIIGFKSYQDDGRVIQKGCVQLRLKRVPPPAGLEAGTAISAGQHWTY